MARAGASGGIWPPLRRRSTRLLETLPIQVVVRRRRAGKLPNGGNRSRRRRGNFDRSVRLTPTSVGLDFGAILFVLSSSTKPHNHFQVSTSVRQVLRPKTVAAVWWVWPTSKVFSGDVSWLRQLGNLVQGPPNRRGKTGGDGCTRWWRYGGTTVAGERDLS